MEDIQSLLKLKPSTFMLNTIRSSLIQPFAFDILLQQLIKENKPTLLILFGQNLQHYSAVSVKCGVNLKSSIDKGLVQVVDTFASTILDEVPCRLDWNLLELEINNKLEALPENGAILIDCLDVLYWIGLKCHDIHKFMHQLLESVRCPNNSRCLFATVNDYGDSKSPWNALLTSLIYQCDTWLDCDKPQTGYSDQINGIIKWHSKLVNTSLTFNYKLSNRSVIIKKL